MNKRELWWILGILILTAAVSFCTRLLPDVEPPPASSPEPGPLDRAARIVWSWGGGCYGRPGALEIKGREWALGEEGRFGSSPFRVVQHGRMTADEQYRFLQELRHCNVPSLPRAFDCPAAGSNQQQNTLEVTENGRTDVIRFVSCGHEPAILPVLERQLKRLIGPNTVRVH